jgi:hypothetical protein
LGSHGVLTPSNNEAHKAMMSQSAPSVPFAFGRSESAMDFITTVMMMKIKTGLEAV